jgi:hypothetical protein
MKEDYKGMAEQFKNVADKTIDSEEYVSIGLVLYRLAFECRFKAVLVSQNRFDEMDKHHKQRDLAVKCNIGIPEDILGLLKDDVVFQHNKLKAFDYEGTKALGPNTTGQDLILKGRYIKDRCEEIWRMTSPHIKE